MTTTDAAAPEEGRERRMLFIVTDEHAGFPAALGMTRG